LPAQTRPYGLIERREKSRQGRNGLTEEAAEVLEGKLEEEQGGQVTAGGGGCSEIDGTAVVGEDALIDQGGQVRAGGVDEVSIKGLQDGVQVTAVIETAVVTAAGEHWWGPFRQGGPGTVEGELPEDGLEQGSRLGGGAAAGGCPGGRQEGFDEGPLLGGEEGNGGAGGG
jgi:hypothetical protein